MNEWNFNFSELKSYAEQELVGRFPDDWKERWPNLASAYARTGVGEELEERLGGTYALPHPIFAEHQPIDPLVWHYVAYMRKDWMEACGIEIKDSYTVEELLDIARAIKEKDPGQVGANLKVINTHVAYMAYLIPYALYEGAWPDGVFFRDADGTVQWGPGAARDAAGAEGLSAGLSGGADQPRVLHAQDQRRRGGFLYDGQHRDHGGMRHGGVHGSLSRVHGGEPGAQLRRRGAYGGHNRHGRQVSQR